MTFEAQRLTIASAETPSTPPILHVFERALRDVSLPIDRVREILDLKREIEADLAEQEYIRVRSLVEQELEPVAKDASNPSTRSKYATLAAVIAAVRPVYSKHGIVIEFDTGLADPSLGDGWIRVLAFLSHQSGYKRTFHIDMPADGKGARGNDVMTRTHATGSAFSYGRRYLLLGIFNIAVEDDDGNAASRNGKTIPETGELLNAEQMEFVWEKAREYCDPDVQQEWVELLVKTLGHDNLAEVPASLFEMLRQKIIAWPKSPAAPQVENAMTVEIIDCVQGSPEWLQAKPRHPDRILLQGREGTRARARCAQPTCAALQARSSPASRPKHSDRREMERGNQMEAEARANYIFGWNQTRPTLVGFMRRAYVGCSPDALLGDDGVLEIKTQKPELLIATHDAGEKDQERFPPEHIAQCQGALLVSGRKWVDLCVYWPGMPMFVRRPSVTRSISTC